MNRCVIDRTILKYHKFEYVVKLILNKSWIPIIIFIASCFDIFYQQVFIRSDKIDFTQP